jgi:hypothetical protein
VTAYPSGTVTSWRISPARGGDAGWLQWSGGDTTAMVSYPSLRSSSVTNAH